MRQGSRDRLRREAGEVASAGDAQLVESRDRLVGRLSPVEWPVVEALVRPLGVSEGEVLPGQVTRVPLAGATNRTRRIDWTRSSR